MSMMRDIRNSLSDDDFRAISPIRRNSPVRPAVADRMVLRELWRERQRSLAILEASRVPVDRDTMEAIARGVSVQIFALERKARALSETLRRARLIVDAAGPASLDAKGSELLALLQRSMSPKQLYYAWRPSHSLSQVAAQLTAAGLIVQIEEKLIAVQRHLADERYVEARRVDEACERRAVWQGQKADEAVQLQAGGEQSQSDAEAEAAGWP